MKGEPPRQSTYLGGYAKDKKQGHGKFTWASGNTYDGSYDIDERHGFGVMRWTDGSAYTGEWAHGV